MYKTNLVTKAMVVAALASLTPVGPAIAQGLDEVRSEAVAFGDLDLSTPEGVATLDNRLQRAIKRVCGVNGAGPIRVTRSVRECRAEAAASVRHARDLAINSAVERGTRLAQVKASRKSSISFRSPN